MFSLVPQKPNTSQCSAMTERCPLPRWGSQFRLLSRGNLTRICPDGQMATKLQPARHKPIPTWKHGRAGTELSHSCSCSKYLCLAFCHCAAQIYNLQMTFHAVLMLIAFGSSVKLCTQMPNKFVPSLGLVGPMHKDKQSSSPFPSTFP